MSFFKRHKVQLHNLDRIKSPIPVKHLDTSKRYDVYCMSAREERVYENVQIIGRRTLDDIRDFGSSFADFIEIEFVDGRQMMIPRSWIRGLCEHGPPLEFRVINRWDDDY